MTGFSDHVTLMLISQLVKVNSRVLQKLLKYFSGTAISTSFVVLSSVVCPEFSLNANDFEFVVEVTRKSLLKVVHLYNIPINFRINCHYTQ